MSDLTHYHIIVFDKKSKSGFKVGKDQIRAFTAKDANDIIDSFRKQANVSAGRAQAKILESSLNNAIRECRDNYNKILNQFVDNINNTNFQILLSEIPDLFIIDDNNLVINENVFTNEFEKIKQITDNLFKKKYNADGSLKDRTPQLIKSQINGMLNDIRGRIFENFIGLMMSESKRILKDLTNNNIEDMLTKNFKKVINKYGNVSIDFGKLGKVTSGQKQTKLDLEIRVEKADDYFDTIILKGGKVKSDISVKIPGANYLNASLKNLANKNAINRQIPLLKKGNVTSLVEQWACQNHLKNLAINGLSAQDLSASQFSIMKKIFIIQAAMGSGSADLMADYFIINTNQKDNPVKVLSMYDIFFSDKDFMKNFGGEEVTGIVPIDPIPRSTEDFGRFVRNTTLSIKTEYSLSQILKNYS